MLSIECDLSYATTLISAASRYFGDVFKQWSKYRYEMEEEVTYFMKHLDYKIETSRMVWIKQQFSSLKRQYEKTTLKKIPQLS